MSQVSLRSAEAGALELDLTQDSARSDAVATTGVDTLVPSKESQVLGGAQPVCSPRGSPLERQDERGEPNNHGAGRKKMDKDHLPSRFSIAKVQLPNPPDPERSYGISTPGSPASWLVLPHPFPPEPPSAPRWSPEALLTRLKEQTSLRLGCPMVPKLYGASPGKAGLGKAADKTG